MVNRSAKRPRGRPRKSEGHGAYNAEYAFAENLLFEMQVEMDAEGAGEREADLPSIVRERLGLSVTFGGRGRRKEPNVWLAAGLYLILAGTPELATLDLLEDSYDDVPDRDSMKRQINRDLAQALKKDKALAIAHDLVVGSSSRRPKPKA